MTTDRASNDKAHRWFVERVADLAARSHDYSVRYDTNPAEPIMTRLTEAQAKGYACLACGGLCGTGTQAFAPVAHIDAPGCCQAFRHLTCPS